MYQARNVSVETGIQKMFAIFGYKLCFAIHIVPALFPLVHYIFGQPTPDLWLTPHNIYDAWVKSRVKACFILTTGVGNDLSRTKLVALFGELLVVRECERNAHYAKFSGIQYSTSAGNWRPLCQTDRSYCCVRALGYWLTSPERFSKKRNLPGKVIYWAEGIALILSRLF